MRNTFLVLLVVMLFSACATSESSFDQDVQQKLTLVSAYTPQSKSIRFTIPESVERRQAYVNGVETGYVETWNKLLLDRLRGIRAKLAVEKNNQVLLQQNQYWLDNGVILKRDRAARYRSKYGAQPSPEDMYAYQYGIKDGTDLAAHDLVLLEKNNLAEVSR